MSSVSAVYAHKTLDVARLRQQLAALGPAPRGATGTACTTLLEAKAVRELLCYISELPVFSSEFAEAFAHDLTSLFHLKTLKYFYNLPAGTLATSLAKLASIYTSKPNADAWKCFAEAVLAEPKLATKTVRHVAAESKAFSEYAKHADKLEVLDPHAVYPTSIYRQCFATTLSNDDASLIEAVMGTTITTSIKIKSGLLEVTSTELRDIYKPLGRCVVVIDKRVDGIYGEDIEQYFAHHKIKLHKLSYSAMEKDKHIEAVQQILIDFKTAGVARNEPVLIVGGGVITDLGGFATALYHRNTPYIMLCTSIVSGIDAGPSPRTCCDGYGYKNIYGAYHPPVLTLTDRYFFKTLHEGWVRHGIAEIIKMAVIKDMYLFELLEEAGPELITTKFGTLNPEDKKFGQICDLIVGKAMEGYVRSEYGNLWETHQCRPHAYGHTWSPGYEIPSGMLHGHAVGTCMGYGAYLAFDQGFISEKEMHRILKLISIFELTLYHPQMDDHEMIWKAQLKVTEKRGGNLCAPVPKGKIGLCGYINNVDKKRLVRTLTEYKEICMTYPRKGLGIEMHCVDVGLEPAGTVGMKETEGSHLQGEDEEKSKISNDTSYAQWIKKEQEKRRSAHDERLELKTYQAGQKCPPDFSKDSLFHPVVESYATAVTTPASEDVAAIAKVTDAEGLFSPCMVGQLEGQFLKMITQMNGAKRVLDVGTFTGYSALSFAEGMPQSGKVVTIENDVKIAKVASRLFKRSQQSKKIDLVVGDAVKIMQNMIEQGQKFDIVFLDADKENYVKYYTLALSGLLNKNGVIMADNSLCSLVYRKNDSRRQALHDFNELVRKDNRVEQVCLSVREGITIIRPTEKFWGSVETETSEKIAKEAKA
mmetsp:Transcript_963/g.1363  ORF Transcript_963/g.1363 Transcript_963/m.1363 type:complete len:872 (-) Transcript_963:265-2880(-)